MSIDSLFVGTLWMVAFGGFLWWYQTRLRDVKEADADDDHSDEARHRLAILKSRVTVEGFVGMGSLIVLLYLLSWLF